MRLSRRVIRDHVRSNSTPESQSGAPLVAVLTSILKASAAVFLLVLGGLVGALAVPAGSAPTPGQMGIFGPVNMVDTSTSGSFTLSTPAGPVTIDVSPSTSYVEPGATTPSFGSLQVGQTVGVRGTLTTTSPTTVLAAVVFIPLANTKGVIWVTRPHRVTPISIAGTAGTVGASGFDLPTTSGAIRVDVNRRTMYFEDGVTTPTLADLAPGASVARPGRSDHRSDRGNTSLDASAVYIGYRSVPVSTTSVPAGMAPASTGALVAGGVISNVSSTGFSYTLGTSTASVLLKTNTTILLNGAATTSASLSFPGEPQRSREYSMPPALRATSSWMP